MSLKRVKQSQNESVVLYGERVRGLGEEAFPGEDNEAELIQRQLIDFFIDGINKGHIAKKVIRDDPKTLKEAIDSAVKEQSMQQKIAARVSRHEPMEIGAIGEDRGGKEEPGFFKDGQKRQMGRNGGRQMNYNEGQRRQMGYNTGQGRQRGINEEQGRRMGGNGEQRRQITCFQCGKKGHMKRECREYQCYNCGAYGHFARNCRNYQKN